MQRVRIVQAETAANAIMLMDKKKWEDFQKSGKKISAAACASPIPPDRNWNNNISTNLLNVKKDDEYVKKINKLVEKQNLQKQVEKAFKQIHKVVKKIYKNTK